MTTEEYTHIAAKYTAHNLAQIRIAADVAGDADQEDIDIILAFVTEACADVAAHVAVELLQKGILHDS